LKVAIIVCNVSTTVLISTLINYLESPNSSGNHMISTNHSPRFHESKLYESVGLYEKSGVQEVDLESGKILKKTANHK
jgi:hypothetical protein